MYDAEKKIQVNDRIRVFGIMAMEKHRDNIGILFDRSYETRTELDDPKLRPTYIYNSIPYDFNNKNLVVNDPEESDKIEGYMNLNANDPNRILITRNGDWIKHVYTDTLKKYKEVGEQWKKGTGGGSGAPENYENWEERDSALFVNYDVCRRSYLTWIYMVDKGIDYLFGSSNYSVPGS